MTGLCQRPIVHNRTRLVIPGAYWTMTGCCLHRVWSCDHRVQSSREKRISPFLTVRSDLVRFSFPSQSAANHAEILSAASSSSRRTTAAAPCPRSHAHSRAFRARAVPPRRASTPVSPLLAAQRRCATVAALRRRPTHHHARAPPCPSPAAASPNSLPHARHRSEARARYREDLTLGTQTLALQRIVLSRSVFREVFISANISVSTR
jgi:hypothetical protein